jgi:hypothetical protein
MKIDPQGWERITVFAFTFKNKIAKMMDNARARGDSNHPTRAALRAYRPAALGTYRPAEIPAATRASRSPFWRKDSP